MGSTTATLLATATGPHRTWGVPPIASTTTGGAGARSPAADAALPRPRGGDGDPRPALLLRLAALRDRMAAIRFAVAASLSGEWIPLSADGIHSISSVIASSAHLLTLDAACILHSSLALLGGGGGDHGPALLRMAVLRDRMAAIHFGVAASVSGDRMPLSADQIHSISSEIASSAHLLLLDAASILAPFFPVPIQIPPPAPLPVLRTHPSDPSPAPAPSRAAIQQLRASAAADAFAGERSDGGGYSIVELDAASILAPFFPVPIQTPPPAPLPVLRTHPSDPAPAPAPSRAAIQQLQAAADAFAGERRDGGGYSVVELDAASILAPSFPVPIQTPPPAPLPVPRTHPSDPAPAPAPSRAAIQQLHAAPAADALARQRRDDGGYSIVELDADELLAVETHSCIICDEKFPSDVHFRMDASAHGHRFKTLQAFRSTGSPKPSGGRPVHFSCPIKGCHRNRAHRRFRPLKTEALARSHFRRRHCPKVYPCERYGGKKCFAVPSDLRSHLRHCGKEVQCRCSCGATFSLIRPAITEPNKEVVEELRGDAGGPSSTGPAAAGQ